MILSLVLGQGPFEVPDMPEKLEGKLKINLNQSKYRALSHHSYIDSYIFVNGQRIQKLAIKQNVLGHVLMLNQSQYTA